MLSDKDPPPQDFPSIRESLLESAHKQAGPSQGLKIRGGDNVPTLATGLSGHKNCQRTRSCQIALFCDYFYLADSPDAAISADV